MRVRRAEGECNTPATTFSQLRRINNSHSLAIGPDGALYFCEIGNDRVRRLDLKLRVISMVAGRKAIPVMAVRHLPPRSTSRTRGASINRATYISRACRNTRAARGR